MSSQARDPLLSVATACEQDRAKGMTRRTALQAGAATAAFASLASLPSRAASSSGTLDVHRFLVSYLAGGFRYSDYDECKNTLGYNAYLWKHLVPGGIPDPNWHRERNRNPVVLHDAYTAFGAAVVHTVEGYWNFVHQSMTVRSCNTERHLFETLSNFLHQHQVNVYGGDIATFMPVHYPSYQRNMQTRFFGTYEDVLRDVAASSGMLQYLTNDASCAPHPNENWARELIELYSIGLQDFTTLWPGGQQDYENDVKEIAKIFSGWGFSKTHPEIPGQPRFGDFVFDNFCHVQGVKHLSFLNPGGVPVAFGPPQDTPLGEGQRLLGILGQHASTALLVAERACRVMLTDTPSQGLVNRIRDAYLAGGGSLRGLAVALFQENALATWRPHENPRFLRPAEWVAWTVRTLGLDFNLDLQTNGTFEIQDTVRAMGNRPGSHPAPDGYPEGSVAWRDTLVHRWNHAYRLATNQYKHIPFNDTGVNAFFLGAPVGASAQWANDRLTGGLLTSQEVNLIQAHLNFSTNQGSPLTPALRETLALTMSAPSAQWLCG